MPLVNRLNPDDLDRIHIQRMDHAHYKLLAALVDLGDPHVDAILGHYSIAILPGRRVAISYPPDVRQVLEKELIAENAKRAKEQAKRERFSKSDCCRRYSPGENHASGCRGKKSRRKR